MEEEKREILISKYTREYSRLQRYGDADRIIKEAAEEYAAGCILENDRIALTRRFLIHFSGKRTEIIPLDSALWVFETQELKNELFSQQEQMIYTLYITTITGERYKIRMEDHEGIEEVTNLLTVRYPNFFYGYSAEHSRMVHYILDENQKELTALRKKGGKSNR
ncbi:MAG: hypothetical protein IKR59_00830 [Lachnospiraceae bacterium]|nr:hypothetical protein [Lachnospiraceae bacterium]